MPALQSTSNAGEIQKLFDTQYLQKALDVDPRFVEAYVYLAKVWLGSEYLSRAQKIIDQALQIAPRIPRSSAWPALCAWPSGTTVGPSNCLTWLSRPTPGSGKLHRGLAIYSFRYREFPRGLEGDAHRHAA